MTKTDKKVARVTVRAYAEKAGVTGRGYGKARPIVVTIHPGDVLILRPLGTRQREIISIEQVYRIAKRSRIASEQAQKLNAKRRRSA